MNKPDFGWTVFQLCFLSLFGAFMTIGWFTGIGHPTLMAYGCGLYTATAIVLIRKLWEMRFK